MRLMRCRRSLTDIGGPYTSKASCRAYQKNKGPKRLHLQVRFHPGIYNAYPVATRHVGELRTATGAPEKTDLFRRHCFYGNKFPAAGELGKEVAVKQATPRSFAKFR